jgi:hypothetical protein
MKALAWRAGLVSAGGVTLLAIIGAAGRTPSTYETVRMPERDDTHLRAYGKPVLAMSKLGPAPTEEDIRGVVAVWLGEYNRGRLFSVAPAHLDDLADKGVRGEILRNRKNLSGAVQMIAVRREETDPATAAALYCDLITLNDIFKFSSPETMTDSTYYQHGALKGLERLMPSLDDKQKASVRTTVKAMLRPAEPLGPFTLRINMAYRRATQGTEEGGMLVSSALRELSTTTPEIVEAKSSKFSALANQEDMLKTISTTMYMALRAEQRVREEATAIADKLK